MNLLSAGRLAAQTDRPQGAGGFQETIEESKQLRANMEKTYTEMNVKWCQYRAELYNFLAIMSKLQS